MVYLDNTTEAQPLFIPKNGSNASGTLIMYLTSTMGLTTTADAVVDIDTSNLFYSLAVTLPEGTAPGEYEYALKKDGETLSMGILAVVCTREIREYDKTIEYEQYNG